MLTVLAKQNTNKTKKPHTFGLSTNTDTDTITASVTVATIELFVIFLLHLVYYLCRSKKKKKREKKRGTSIKAGCTKWGKLHKAELKVRKTVLHSCVCAKRGFKGSAFTLFGPKWVLKIPVLIECSLNVNSCLNTGSSVPWTFKTKPTTTTTYPTPCNNLLYLSFYRLAS